MIRGTTPTFTLTLNDETLDLTSAQNVYVTFKQGYKDYVKASVTKSGYDIVVSEKEVSVCLTQKESLQFKEGPLYIQVNWTYADGSRACSEIVKIEVKENLLLSVIK